ncbi:unnamed protein product [Adineta steineri]|uniref:EGF-like domain-containing protein n=1 Tax=Adineta steineri TaxID=433720 RepID=A0A819N9C6_9BILA|nr:unnamed protein product [Adineta steineri]
MCVCPTYKFGPRCFMKDTKCELNNNKICNNSDQCIRSVINRQTLQPYTCICSKGLHGDRCEHEQNRTEFIYHLKKNSFSLFNGLFTLITFKSKILREVGCDYFLRIFIHMDQWLNAYVACERAITVVKGARFSKKKSKKVTKFIIILLLIFNIFIFIHEPLYRQLIDETDEDKNEKRIWCVVSYSSNLQIYNSVINTFQFFTPLIINFISAFILIAQKPRRQSITQRKRNFKDILKENYREHKHLFIAPAILVILALPRLIISFISKCIQSSDDSWLFPTAYFISLIPSNAYFYCICITIEIL